MIVNYFMTSLRNLRKNPGISLINILGLAAGLTCCILIMLYIVDELSYDRHWPYNDRIYRIASRGLIGHQEINSVQTPTLLSRTLVQDFPEIKSATRIQHTPNMLIRFNEIVFNETHFLWVDTNFFDIFAIPLVYGDPRTALKDDHTVVMTLSNARRFFGDPAEALNQIVNYEDGTPYRVTGVVADPVANAHFHYGMLSPLSSWEWNRPESWLWNMMLTYIRLHDPLQAGALEAKFPDFIARYFTSELQRETGMSLAELEQSGHKLEYFLQPLTDIHLNSQFDGELQPNSDIKYIYIFVVIALFILFIAAINFMNLSTARSAGRCREVGLRKVLGSTRSRLMGQFLIESVVIAVIAGLIAILLTVLLLPYFNQLAGKQIHLAILNQWFGWPAILLFALVVGGLAGLYPAFLLSSFQPVAVLKENLALGLKGHTLRSLLVILQFTLSIFLFITTLVMFRQLHFIRAKHLGFTRENIVVIKRGWAIGQKPDGSQISWGENEMAPIDAFKADLLANPRILAAAGSTFLPGEMFGTAVLIRKGAANQETHPINYFRADYDFAETFNLELVEGRWLARESGDRQGVVINEAAARAFGLERPYTSQLLGVPNEPEFSLPIVGVVKDYHYESLHKPIMPLAISATLLDRTYLSVRIRPEEVPQTIAWIEQVWNRYLPYKPFEYFFFDHYYDSLYHSEQRTSVLFTSASMLAILIACLGLLGLASFTTERRFREIGIRKALGASAANILMLISREFAALVLIANLVAWPAAWYFSRQLLQNFAYRINLNLWSFILAGLLALLVALLTISYQALRAAMSDPVKTLRYE